MKDIQEFGRDKIIYIKESLMLFVLSNILLFVYNSEQRENYFVYEYIFNPNHIVVKYLLDI